MARQANSQEASARPRRSPVSRKNRLDVRNKKDGYMYRIVNMNTLDGEQRVQDLLEQGYEMVPKDEVGTVGDKRVDNASALGSEATVSLGRGDKGVVMRIREDWYKEDQTIKQSEVDATEQTMKRDAKKASDYGNFTIER